MRQATTKALYSLHAWCGIVTGVLLFVICFSGAVVVFKHEIDLWANPMAAAAPRVDQPVGFATVMAALHAHDPDFAVESIAAPDAQMPAYMVFGKNSSGQRVKLSARADTGVVLGPGDSELGQFIRSLHVFLFFGPRWIVGFMGVVMLALIVTGVLIHQKMLNELFTQRWKSSLRLMLSDAHKLIGVWGLLFHLLIAFTGAWLGLAPVFVGAARHLGLAPVVAQPPPEAGPITAMHDLDALHAQAQAALPEIDLRRVTFKHWGQQQALVTFSGPSRVQLGMFGRIVLRMADAAEIERRDPREAGVLARVNGWMEPLHFGDFGGLTLKWLYFILGMSPALLSITGTWLWIDQQRSGAGVAGTATSAA